jgi:hypothetical protein
MNAPGSKSSGVSTIVAAATGKGKKQLRRRGSGSLSL